MKKVLSALVLSAAVVATAGQAHAYGNFNIMNGTRGTLVGVIYTDNTEIIMNLGNFKTNVNRLVYDHEFSQLDKTLATVDYRAILDGRGDYGSVHMSFYIDDMKTAAATPRYWDAYYATTDASHGGEIPTPVTGSFSNTRFKTFNTNSSTFLSNTQQLAVSQGGADVLVVDGNSPSFWQGRMNDTIQNGVGSYGGINIDSSLWGELNLDDYADNYEIDMFLFGVRHDTAAATWLNPDIGSSATGDDWNKSLGQIATLRFDTRNGAITLNASGDVEMAPVPVPAAAWLLGSGLFGLVGLRRRK